MLLGYYASRDLTIVLSMWEMVSLRFYEPWSLEMAPSIVKGAPRVFMIIEV